MSTKKNRIAIYYGGTEFAVSGRTLDEVTSDIQAGVASAVPAWLEARVGQGRSTPVRLLLGAGIPIAVGEVNTDGAPAERDGKPALGAALAPTPEMP